MKPDEKRKAVEAVERAVADNGCEVLKLTIGDDRVVHLQADADPGPFTINECTRLNFAVRDALAAAGLGVDDYAVEVESAGTNRPLLTARHFQRFTGRYVCMVMRQETATDRKRFNGILRGMEGDMVLLELEDLGLQKLPLSRVQEAQLDARYS